MTTDQGPTTFAFYYDIAPNTVDSFLRLADQGYFDGLTFHRIVPGFVLQGGDPRGDGMGGPGYQVNARHCGALPRRSGRPLSTNCRSCSWSCATASTPS